MKILVTYSSGFGTTREISEEIARILLQESSFHIDTMSIDKVEGVGEFDGVIIGSSVRADKPLANVRDFFNRFRSELALKKVALFAVCLTANCEKGRQKVFSDYLSQITDKYSEIKPISIEAFGGKIDFNKLNPVMQNLMRRVLEKTGLPTGGSIDTRDWNFIRNWALALKDKLKN
jgi:menaquinone-dependent protoporphyrinogen IX oxidase